MQSYEKDLNLLSDFLDFLKHKADSKTLTLGEAEGLKRMFLENMNLSATADDLAAYYGKSRQDVWNIVHRKLLGKPVRKVHYSFDEFNRIVPKGWKRNFQP